MDPVGSGRLDGGDLLVRREDTALQLERPEAVPLSHQPGLLDHTRRVEGLAPVVHDRRAAVEGGDDPLLQRVAVAARVRDRHQGAGDPADRLRRLHQGARQLPVTHDHPAELVTHSLPGDTPAPRAAPSSA